MTSLIRPVTLAAVFRRGLAGVARPAAGVLLAAAIGVVPVTTAGAASVVAYYEDFDGVAVGASPFEFGGGGGSARQVQGYAGVGTGANTFSGMFLRNGNAGQPQQNNPSVLTLTGLAPHTSIDLNFLLAVIDSWDGSSGPASPDRFNVEVDGTVVFSQTFDQYVPADQGYVAPPGVELTARDPSGGFPDLWTGVSATAAFGDSAYDLGLDPALNNIPHTSSTLTVRFYASGVGWQGSPMTNVDESWAIDNVGVVLNTAAPVPLPSSALAGFSLVAAAGGMRLVRRRRRP